MFIIIWEFRPNPERWEEFIETYGAHGAWAQLFRKGDGYLRTDLLEDLSHPGVFITVDCWTSRQSYERFRAEHAVEYTCLDKACSILNETERHVGSFKLPTSWHAEKTG